MTAAARSARRIVPLREIIRKNAKPRAKKPAPSFPTALQLAQVTARLRSLVHAGEAAKVDCELAQLLVALGLDPASPAAWRDGFLMLAALYCGVGMPRRTNRNAEKLSGSDNFILLCQISRLTDQGLTQEQAINKLAAILKLKSGSSAIKRVETLRKRITAIKKKSARLEDVFGSASISTVEEALINLALAEVRKNKPAFYAVRIS